MTFVGPMHSDDFAAGVRQYVQSSSETVHVEKTGTPEPSQEKENQKPRAWKPAWVRYSSIENCSNSTQLNDVRLAVAAKLGANCEWIASEKVHGSNFCFETDGHHVQYSSRTNKLGGDANFFSAREEMPRYHPFVLKAFRLAQERVPTLTSILIYGEYFGGYYPGNPARPGCKKVQGGVAYSPGHHFYAFDVNLGGKEYMDFDSARALLLAAGFPLVPEPLWRGSLDDLLAIDVETFQTTIPSQLGHPPLDRFRIAEGIVIRPVREVCFGQHRAILKKKGRAFWEATNQFTLAPKVPNSAQAGWGIVGLEFLLEAVRGLCTDNRVRAVISKDPALLEDGQDRKLAGLFAKDILEDLQKKHDDGLTALGKDVAALKRSLQLIARSFVQDRIAHIREDVG